MEIFELKYFLGVAQSQNIHKASEKLFVSPGSLSKAISRLENELGIKLFSREGRNIRLTEQGIVFQKRASEIIHLEEAVKIEVLGHKGVIRVRMAGDEMLLSKIGLSFSKKIKTIFQNSSFEFISSEDQKTIEQVLKGEVHIGFITMDSPKQLYSKNIEEIIFRTCVGQGHKLYSLAKKKKSISINEILKYPFVSPSFPISGQMESRQSLDGWRDDKFPRQISHKASSLKILEEIVTSGEALAYLPDYYIKKIGVEVLKITGCAYSCSQTVKLIARNPQEISWLNQIF